MAIHCEKLIKKLIDKHFKLGSEPSINKSSNTY